MGTITVVLTATQTVAVANGAALQTIQDWVKVNILDKLPAAANVVVNYQVIP
jgi:hypothetical protein